MLKVKLLSSIVMSILLITGWAYSATFTVTTANDSGNGSLRWAIEQANSNPGADTINFSVSDTISPTSALPEITDDETLIDASSQWSGTWPGGAPGITLDGTNAGVGADGLVISGADNCHIRGLFITNFDDDGVRISNGAQSNTIGGTGVKYRKVISKNSGTGVYIYGSGTDNNTVCGNYIGTNANGTADLGNSGSGVFIYGGAKSNTIGGTTAGERNIISGNDSIGVYIGDSGTDSNTVSGNYIGTDVNGTADLGNSSEGIRIAVGAQSNTIGGTTAGEKNIISGNIGGVFIGGSGANGNTVYGNYIGTDVNGTADLGNSNHGVYIYAGAQSNTIGGTTAGERNIISGNDIDGVRISGSGTDSNTVYGNYIGTDVNGTADLGNSNHGVHIYGGAQSNTIGGTGNTIAFNGQDGVEVENADTDYNKISQNSIHDNTSLGIDLAGGGNDEISAPTITSNNLVGNTLTVSGNGAGTNATVELFEADSAASGEGKTYLGSLTADGSGNFSGSIDVTGKGLSVGDPLVATTTHTNNNTSEFSTADTTLPVELSVFTATASDGKVTIHWRTETEVNNVGFSVYRSESKDGNYTKLAFVPGAGNSAMSIDYQFTDKKAEEGKTYFYYLEDIDIAGERSKSKIIKVVVPPAKPVLPMPKAFRLLQNYPNPFNPDTWLPYQLAASVPVVISIYNIKGQLVRELNMGNQKAGYYVTKSKAVYWDGKNECGEKSASGVYWYRLRGGEFNTIRRMVILK